MTFNPTRLGLARRRRGLTKRALADAVGLSSRSITAYEAGAAEPSSDNLVNIAATLDFPTRFFSAGDVVEPSIEGVSFRAKTSMTARQRDQAIGASAIALDLHDYIDTRFTLPVVNVPRVRATDPEAAAEEVRALWGLGERPIGNLVHLLESHGVRVFTLVEECADVDAYSFWRDGVPFIFLNTMKSAERSRMDAAHELGHLVMHFWGGPGGREAEAEAQAFGSAFLMPQRSVIAHAPRGGGVPQIVKAKRRWKVSAMNLAYRMRALGLLTEWQARTVYVEMGKRNYRKHEPNGIPRETSQVLAKVFAALRAQGVTTKDVADELAVPADEIRKLMFGLITGAAPSGVSGEQDSQPAAPVRLRVVGDG